MIKNHYAHVMSLTLTLGLFVGCSGTERGKSYINFAIQKPGLTQTQVDGKSHRAAVSDSTNAYAVTAATFTCNTFVVPIGASGEVPSVEDSDPCFVNLISFTFNFVSYQPFSPACVTNATSACPFWDGTDPASTVLISMAPGEGLPTSSEGGLLPDASYDIAFNATVPGASGQAPSDLTVSGLNIQIIDSGSAQPEYLLENVEINSVEGTAYVYIAANYSGEICQHVNGLEVSVKAESISGQNLGTTSGQVQGCSANSSGDGSNKVVFPVGLGWLNDIPNTETLEVRLDDSSNPNRPAGVFPITTFEVTIAPLARIVLAYIKAFFPTPLDFSVADVIGGARGSEGTGFAAPSLVGD